MVPVDSDRIPLSRPDFGLEEETAVAECLRSGWVTSGPRVAEFERAFARVVGSEEGVATSSGTAALHLALWSLGLEPGDEVITPSLTWVSAPNVIALLGARPVFCDVDPETLTLDVKDAALVVTPRTKAIVPMHFAGRVCDLKAVQEFAAAHKLVVIEDAAHAIGARYRSKPIGSHSGLCAFSFHPNKNITTGEGGMLTGLDRERLAFARRHRYHGLTRDAFGRSEDVRLPHDEESSPGLKYIMSDIAAAIGLCQLQKLDGFNATRAHMANLYREALAPFHHRIWVPAEDPHPDNRHAWHLFTIRVQDEPGLRDRVMRVFQQYGIGVGLHYSPIHQLSWIRKRQWGRPLPHTELVGRTIMSLPLYPGMTKGHLERVVDLLLCTLNAR